MNYNTGIAIDGLDIAIFTNGEFTQKLMDLQVYHPVKRRMHFFKPDTHQSIVYMSHYITCSPILKNA